MSDPTLGHDRWLELAAGHAVHALEPAEEALLTVHLSGCDDCRRALDEYTFVAAQLGTLSTDADLAPSWETIRPQLPAPTGVNPPAELAAVRRARHGWQTRPARLLAAAAAVVVLVAGGVAGGQLIGHGGGPPTTTAAACRIEPGCHLVALHGQTEELAAVLISNGQARLVPQRMTPPPTNRMYVLWQLPRDGSPIPLMEFRLPASTPPTGTLARSYDDTAAFAVSLEPASHLPTHPTVVLATGAAGT